MLKRYGLKLDDWDRIFERQRGACAACGELGKKLQIDHDHETGRVRALLCAGCNTAIAHVGESTERLRLLIRYLQRHKAASMRTVSHRNAEPL